MPKKDVDDSEAPPQSCLVDGSFEDFGVGLVLAPLACGVFAHRFVASKERKRIEKNRIETNRIESLVRCI